MTGSALPLRNTGEQRKWVPELDARECVGLSVDGETIENIKARIAQCRRLAAFTTDKHVAKILLQMAEEAEADLRRIGAKTANGPPQITIEIGHPKTRS